MNPVCHGAIDCFAISTFFGVIAFVTTSGVCVCELEHCQISFRCELEEIDAKAQMISDGLGFIIIACNDFSLFVFNMSDELIRQSSTEENNASSKYIMNREDLDFFVTGDNDGDVCVCAVSFVCHKIDLLRNKQDLAARYCRSDRDHYD
jgi:hypothetical protein